MKAREIGLTSTKPQILVYKLCAKRFFKPNGCWGCKEWNSEKEFLTESLLPDKNVRGEQEISSEPIKNE